MDVINLARELGKAIQQDNRFIEMDIAKQNVESDEVLQGVIGEFNLKKFAINNEMSKEGVDQEKINKLNDEMMESYQFINTNENMICYNKKRKSLNDLIRRIISIITQSAEGGDPETVDYDDEGCSGHCSNCSGCSGG